MAEAPEFLVCINCETPCYVFEYKEGRLAEAFCEACGNDEADNFASPDDFEALTSG